MPLTTEGVRTSQSPSKLRQELIDNGDDKSYRHAYADESLNISVATQLKVLREQRELTQEALAAEAGMQQPMISRYENVNYSSWSISTLKKLAAAFDVWLDVRFRSFGELVTTTDEFSRKSLQVPKFNDDLFFKIAPAPATKSERPYARRFSNDAIPIDIAKKVLEGGEQGTFPLIDIAPRVKRLEGGVDNAARGNIAS